ncbi:cAMP-regulated phosphoprotein 21 [Cynoglossus semilaevis]|uniref:cAMP-regulated phosphoprotein 21 n=1 Tax=Cynoglossus semilaevis TaxID=244447 RepID=UPI0004984C76|nr:cAMP-regulated phosphoprotein 21 [Cynoglossus semilaevis]
MTEAAVESAQVLLKACDVPPCDVISCPSPTPCLSLCSQREEEERHHDSKKPEQQKHCNQVQPKKKVKAKGKLVRTVAVCEESSPFEESQASQDTNVSSGCHDDERTSCREEEQETLPEPKKLTKESSVEYTDSTGIDLHHFITETLNSNPRDRMMLLKLEQDMIDFITSNSAFKKFPHMSSYHRMLVHRVAAYFGMEHNVDHTGKSVIINRTSSTRIPEQRFVDQVDKDKEEINCWKFILKRDNSSDDQNRTHTLREKQSKSVEEREEEYQKVRERIFNQEPFFTQESAHAETRAVEDYNPYAETQRKRQLFRNSRKSSSSSWNGSSKQSSTEIDCRYSNEPQPWSSIDSDSSCHWTSSAPKHCHPANHSWEPQGSGSIALYRLPATCPQSSSPPVREEPTHNSSYIMENGIPPGSILVNPHTGQPFLNPDGSPAVYIPPDSQPPIRSQTQPQSAPSQQQQVVQYSSVSYSAPQMLPVPPPQPMEDLSSQFAHVTLSCQSAGEAPPLYPHSQGYVYAAPPPPPPPLPPPPNPPSYCQPSPQVPVYYYGQYSTSAQHGCRPVSPSQHLHSQVAQPTAGYAPPVGVQQPTHTQAQAVLGTYSPMASHQCSVVQGGLSLSYPPTKVVPAVGGEVGYCCVVPPPPHHSSCHPPSCSNLSAPSWSGQY